jgi:hypothetical protein
MMAHLFRSCTGAGVSGAGRIAAPTPQRSGNTGQLRLPYSQVLDQTLCQPLLNHLIACTAPAAFLRVPRPGPGPQWQAASRLPPQLRHGEEHGLREDRRA